MYRSNKAEKTKITPVVTAPAAGRGLKEHSAKDAGRQAKRDDARCQPAAEGDKLHSSNKQSPQKNANRIKGHLEPQGSPLPTGCIKASRTNFAVQQRLLFNEWEPFEYEATMAVIEYMKNRK